MAEKAHMVEYLKAMLNPNDEIRNQTEKLLQSAAAQNADAFVGLSLEIIGDQSIEAATRNMACIVLKKVLTVFQSDQVKAYKQLSPAGKEGFQRNILLLLSNEQTPNIRDQICDLISDVASSVISDDALPAEDKWPNLLQHLFEIFNTNTEPAILAVFRILDGLFANVASHFTGQAANFFKLFQFGFAHASIKVNIAALEALTSLIQTVKAKDLKVYKPLNVSVLQLVGKALGLKDEEDIQTCVGFVYDICESEPSFIKAKFNELIEVMTAVRAFPVDSDSALKIESVECLVFMVERYPALIKDSPQRIQKLLEAIFFNMMEIEIEVAPEWCSPPEGFNDDLEEDDDQKDIKIGMDFIDRLMVAVDHNIILAAMNQAIQTLLSKPDWKSHHAAIMAMSQLGEYMSERIDSDVLNILKQVQAFAANPNPRIRYACCHLLGQYADDLNPDFQSIHKDVYFATVLPLLNDPVPRVVAHALASLTNFLENASSDQVGQENFNFIYERTMFWLANGIGYVKEACLSTMSALCEGSGELFFPVYDQTMVAIFQVFGHSKSKTQKQLRGNAIECATIIGKICGMERFEKFYPQLIQEMVNIQNSDIDLTSFDPQKSYVLSGWQRMVISIEDRFKPYIPAVLPRLLQIAKSAHSSSSGENVRTSDAEETEIAVQTIAVFLDILGVELLPYLTEIYNVLYLIIENTLNEETRIEATKSLPPLIKIYRKSGQDISQFGRHVNTTLWALMDKDTDPSTLAEFAFTIQKTLKNMGPVLSDAEVAEVYRKCYDHLLRSNTRKQNIADNFDKEEEDQKEIDNIIEGDNQLEDELALEIANIIGVLFRVYKERALPIFGEVYANLITPAMKDGKTKSKHFGMFLIDDAVEHLGAHLPKETLKLFLTMLSPFVLDKELELRQAALFGVGIVAVALGPEFPPLMPQVMQLLASAIDLPKAEDDYHKFFLTVKENGVASLGKILQTFGASLPPADLTAWTLFWLKNLPIVHDHKEAVGQHQFLLKLVTSQPPVINLMDADILKRVVEVLAKIYTKKKLTNEEMNVQIGHIVRSLKNNEQTRGLLVSIPFGNEEKEFLSREFA